MSKLSGGAIPKNEIWNDFKLTVWYEEDKKWYHKLLIPRNKITLNISIRAKVDLESSIRDIKVLSSVKERIKHER